jgi:hypothetical protein
MNQTTTDQTERLNRTAAFASAQLEELLQLMPPSQLAKDIRKIIDRIDKEFGCVAIGIEVE